MFEDKQLFVLIGIVSLLVIVGVVVLKTSSNDTKKEQPKRKVKFNTKTKEQSLPQPPLQQQPHSDTTPLESQEYPEQYHDMKGTYPSGDPNNRSGEREMDKIINARLQREQEEENTMLKQYSSGTLENNGGTYSLMK